MSNIYQKIKGKAGKLRKSYVSLGSEDGSVSPTKLNKTLVEGSKGISEKFVNHSDALMEGYNETINEDGASFGDDLASDGNKDVFDGVSKYGSPAKNKNTAAEEAAEKLKSVRVKREGEFKNEAGDALDVYDTTTTTPGETDDYDGSGGYASDEDWQKFLDSEDGKAYTEKYSPKEEVTTEMNVRPEEKEETTPGEKADYNMGWMESRNAKKARRVQLRDDKKKTRQYNKIIKKFEKGGGSSSDERMSPEVRAAYAHFTKDGSESKFDSAIGSTTGVNKPSETVVTKGNEAGAEGAVTLDKDGKPITKFGSPTKFGPIGAAIGKAALGMAAKKLTSGIGYKMQGPLYKKQ